MGIGLQPGHRLFCGPDILLRLAAKGIALRTADFRQRKQTRCTNQMQMRLGLARDAIRAGPGSSREPASQIVTECLRQSGGDCSRCGLARRCRRFGRWRFRNDRRWRRLGRRRVIRHNRFRRLAKRFYDPEAVVRVGFTLGQDIYTPRDIKIADPQPWDRPWAGWTYIGALVQAASPDTQDTVELNINFKTIVYNYFKELLLAN